MKPREKKQSLETMRHTVNLRYNRRQEMAENPKRRAEFGNLLKLYIICQLVRWLYSRSQFKQSSEMFWRPKGKQSLETQRNLPAEPFKVAVLSVLQQLVVEHGPGASQQDSMPNQIQIQTKLGFKRNTWCYCLPQSRQSARLFLQSAEMGPPHPLTRRLVCPPLWFREPGWGGGPNPTWGQTLCYSKYILCVLYI